jgi:maleylpyruvate isomerase
VTRRSLADALRWVETGTSLLDRAVEVLDDAGFAAPSALPGWSRAHVLAHLAGNARALLNLVTWARTGIETPMYASPGQRLGDIEYGAALAPFALRADVRATAAALGDAMAGLDDRAWSRLVRTAQGRTVPASEIPWLRAREVLIHPVDLTAGVTFADAPADFLVALVDDVVANRRATADHPALVLHAGARAWEITGTGEPVSVEAPSIAALAAYLTGRDRSAGPDIPSWL